MSKFFELDADLNIESQLIELIDSPESQESIKSMKIGVIIAKQILSQYDGNLQVSSNVQYGTKLSFNFKMSVVLKD